MNGYGQYCPLALASEIVGERWTLLVLRELMLGATHFNDIHRGVPRMSRTLLARRLRSLQAVGILERNTAEPGSSEYVLTDSGRALMPVIESLAIWGKQWVPATLSEAQADPDLIVWDMHRRLALEQLPDSQVVIEFQFPDQPAKKQQRWLVGNRHGMVMCITDPGCDADLAVVTDSHTLVLVWYGDVPLQQAIEERRIHLHGPDWLCRSFPDWLRLSPMAGIERKKALHSGADIAATRSRH